jgi:hypothetical protein
MGLKALNDILATLGLAGHALLTALVIRRRLAYRLPPFTVLIVFYLFRSAILFLGSVKSSGAALFWVMIALDPILQCVLCATIIRSWLPKAGESKSLRRLAAFGLVIIAAACSGLAAWYIGPSSHFSSENLAIKAGVFVSVLWIEAGFALAASSVGLLRKLPKLTRTVVQGFVIYSAANIITEIGHMHFARLRAAQPYVELSYMRVAAYLVCLAWWIIGSVREARIPMDYSAASANTGRRRESWNPVR